MKRNSAKLLLEFSVGLGIATLITTYLISTTSGRVAAFIPIISEMPFNEPEATIFGTGLGISIFSFLILAQVFHQIFEPLAKNIGNNYENWNDMIRIIATMGAICGVITVNFHWNIYPLLHGFTAFILFTSFLIWGTFAYILLEKSGKGNDKRKYAVYAGWIFYVLMFIFSVADNLELREKEEDFFYRMDNPPNVDTERSTYLNLTALCEWCMVFSFYAGALTYRKELEGISI
tara:strand:+ start:1214 stop:1912 length:699 start_codon:yes stop_codon:yes gene_type:complete